MPAIAFPRPNALDSYTRIRGREIRPNTTLKSCLRACVDRPRAALPRLLAGLTIITVLVTTFVPNHDHPNSRERISLPESRLRSNNGRRTTSSLVSSLAIFRQPSFPVKNNTSNRLHQWEHQRRLEDVDRLPSWLIDYVLWHNQERVRLDSSNQNELYESASYIVLRCFRRNESSGDIHCGGLSDRLKPLPLLLQLAARARRLFFIYWNKPCALTEFLSVSPAVKVQNKNLPHLDWTVPPWLVPHMDCHGEDCRLYTTVGALTEGVLDGANEKRIVMAKLQDQHGGSSTYNDYEASRLLENVTINRAYRSVYGPLFRLLFTPANAVAERLERAFQSLQLLPNQYVATHLRTNYGNHPIPTAQIRTFAANAVQCASHLRWHSNQTVFFTSDSVVARRYVQDHYTPQRRLPGIRHSVPLGQRAAMFHRGNNSALASHDNGPLNHAISSSSTLAELKRKPETKQLVSALTGRFDKEKHLTTVVHLDQFDSHDPADFYDIFVDLYLMSYASRVAHAQGGFGRLGVLVSYNPTEFLSFFTGGQWVQCEWHDA
jgi:hypothetical protein